MPQNQTDDPFGKYGGHSVTSDDPFAAYGGKSLSPSLVPKPTPTAKKIAPIPERPGILERVGNVIAPAAIGGGLAMSPSYQRGLKESFGLPSWDEAKQFLTKLYENPRPTLEGVYSDFDKVSKFAYDNPGKFMWAMTNVPAMQKAWHAGHYKEALGILTGTGIQAATIVGEVGKAQRLPFKEGLTGKTADVLKAEEAEAATPRAAKETLQLTLGERLGSPKFERAEQIIRGMPGVGGRFGQMEKERQGLLFSFKDQMSAASQTLYNRSQTIYKELDKAVPEFNQMQQARRDAYEVGRQLDRGGHGAEARVKFIEADELRNQLNALVEKSGNKDTVAAWQHADKLYTEASAKERVVDAIHDAVLGYEEPDPLARVSEAAPKLKPLGEKIKSLGEDAPKGGRSTLEKAIPDAQARSDLRSIAGLYDRIQVKRQGYIAMRVLGWAMVGGGLLGTHFGSGYLAELAGGYLMANTLAAIGEKAAGSVRFKNFLIAVDKGELTRAERLAESISRSADAKLAADEALRKEKQAAGDEQLRRYFEMKGRQTTAPEPPGAPEVLPADNPPELDKYAKLQADLARNRHLNEAIRRLSGSSKKPLNDTEIEWIGQQTGVDMTQPGAIAKARKALVEQRNALRNPSK